MPSKNPTIQKAYKDGTITKGQYDKLPDALLLGIIKKKKNGGGGGKGGGGKKGPKKGGVKEERHKLGKESHKPGRPKGGSKVRISK
tara:strand:+ start:44 stop:301 length:258 start_codon:yes stop_codon:yes gene_type:complete